MLPEGSVFFQDTYNTIYESNWSTTDGVLDITSVTREPLVWGQAPEGYIKQGILYKKGIITVERQIIKELPDGYEIIADGVSQYTDFIALNFPCLVGPKDTFKFHLNHDITSDVDTFDSMGPRWADPDNPEDNESIWVDVNAAGHPIADLTVTGGAEYFEFIDVWAAP